MRFSSDHGYIAQMQRAQASIVDEKGSELNDFRSLGLSFGYQADMIEAVQVELEGPNGGISVASTQVLPYHASFKLPLAQA